MKIRILTLGVFLSLAAPLFTSCTSASSRKQNPAAVASTGKDGKAVADDLEQVGYIADPLEPVNRVTFWVNHQLYTFILRPVSKSYEFVVPKPVRRGVYNVFENLEFPIRLVNDGLQGNFPRMGQETGKFLLNSTVGVAGIFRPSNNFPALADVPPAGTAQTFAKWGIGHGIYLVVPLIGPSSTRELVGLAGDYALNPVSWVAFYYGHIAWTIPVSVAETLRIMPDKFSAYDAATQEAVDRYLAVRTAWVQYREAIAKQ